MFKKWVTFQSEHEAGTHASVKNIVAAILVFLTFGTFRFTFSWLLYSDFFVVMFRFIKMRDVVDKVVDGDLNERYFV